MTQSTRNIRVDAYYFLYLLVLAPFLTTGCPRTATTFITGLPESAQNSILWYCDFEDFSFSKWEGRGRDDADAGGGIFVTDESNTSYGIEQNVVHSGYAACFTTIKNAVTPGEPKAVRLMRWTNRPWYEGGEYFPDTAYYSTFFRLNCAYNPGKEPDNDPNNDGGWWNIFQFKSKNYAGSQPIVTLDLYNENNHLYFGMVVKDYTDDNSSEYSYEYIVQENPISIPVNKWNHVEALYSKSKEYQGKVIIWLNGIKIFEKDGVRTMLPPAETVVFGIGNYTDYISGGPVHGEATIYFDDVIISTTKISDYLK